MNATITSYTLKIITTTGYDCAANPAPHNPDSYEDCGRWHVPVTTTIQQDAASDVEAIELAGDNLYGGIEQHDGDAAWCNTEEWPTAGRPDSTGETPVTRQVYIHA